MPTLMLSYVHGACGVPLLGETIGALLDRIAKQFPDRPALVVRHQGIRWTYAQLREEVDRAAAGLIALGLQPGERVGVWSPNNAEWVVAQFATAKAGLILVNINPAYRLHELKNALNKSGCQALILARAFKSANYAEMLRSLAPELNTCDPGELHSVVLPALRLVSVIADSSNNPAPPGMMTFRDIAARADQHSRARLAELAGTLQFDDIINIQFTSGTTGSPKGAALTHHNLVNNGFFVGEMMRFTEADRLCIPVPFYHCFGMVLGNLACVTHGACMVVPSEGFDPLAVLETIAAERCTALHGVPTMFIAELAHPRFHDFDLTSLRTGIMAGSPCPIEVMRRVVAEMHASEITIAYGMTETSPVSFQSSTADSLERRVSTVGRVHPHVEAKVIEVDRHSEGHAQARGEAHSEAHGEGHSEGRIVPRGVTGELLVRGYAVMQGYWQDEEKTRESIDAAGWIHTGDLATIDEEGFCNIVGRSKDMVIRGGENIYPREIEEYLYGHPAIQDVQVFGVPDAKYGEELAAWVILKPPEASTERGSAAPPAATPVTSESIRAFCEGHIARYKIPRYIKFVESFPTTVTGKVQKFVMREAMAKELGLMEVQTA